MTNEWKNSNILETTDGNYKNTSPKENFILHLIVTYMEKIWRLLFIESASV